MDFMNKSEEVSCYAYVERDNRIDLHGNRRKWVCCPYCGKKAFYVWETTRINNMPFQCKGSNCKKDFIIDV